MLKILNILGSNRRSSTEAISHSDYRAIFDNLDEIVFKIDTNGRWVFLNPSWEKLTGFPVDYAIGKNFLSFVHVEDSQHCSDYLRSTIENDSPEQPVSFRCLKKDESSVWVDLHARRLLDEENLVGISGTLLDVSERMHETSLQQASYRSLESLANHLPGMVYRCRNNKNWTMEYVSQGCYKLTGYRQPELINNETIAYADLIHPEDRQMVVGGSTGRGKGTSSVYSRISRYRCRWS